MKSFLGWASEMSKKIKVAILGTGNIGTDLLIKVLRSDYLECAVFVGRNFQSPGMAKAASLGVKVSDRGIEYFKNEKHDCKIVFDATSAESHLLHSPVFENLGILAIDMTPAKVGEMVVPVIGYDGINEKKNINMITCGGQASIPIAYAINKVCTDIEVIETVSTISAKSAGPATRANIDEYIAATENGLKKYSEAKSYKAMININPASPPINMQTTVMVKVENPDIKSVENEVKKIVGEISKYVPGYELVLPPIYDPDTKRLITTVRVEGVGDYLPKYAGNLDIINCAAIRVAENYYKEKFGE